MFQDFSEGARFWYLGAPYTLIVRPFLFAPEAANHLRMFDRVTLEGTLLVVETGHPFPITIERLVRRWYSQQTQAIFEERLDRCLTVFKEQFADALQKKISSTPSVPNGFSTSFKPGLTIRFFKARWGHMTRRHVMALNCELIHVPLEYVDAVIFHELVHILHFNHQKAFHECLERLVPNHKQVHKELEKFWIARQDEYKKSKSFVGTSQHSVRSGHEGKTFFESLSHAINTVGHSNG